MARRDRSISDLVAQKYNTVAAGQTDQALISAGGAGAAGDLLGGLLIVPAAGVAPGAVSIKDGAGPAITVFAANAGTAVPPSNIQLGIVSTAGAWKVTTGTNVSVLAYGRFT